MDSRKNSVNGPKFGMTGFVPEYQHSRQTAKSTPKNCGQQQGLLRNSPTAADGFELVDKVE